MNNDLSDLIHIKRWINILDETQNTNRINDTFAIINKVKKEMKTYINNKEKKDENNR
jgi:hypothetical protein